MNEDTAILRIVLRRGLLRDDLALVPVHFEAGVLDRYREAGGFSLIRTDTVGRVKKEGGWVVDVGIAPDETTVHAFAGDLLRLPPDEREHWASFAVALPSSRMFLQMRLAPGACHDDGEPRKWE
ncbi:MAG TPA: hypothetical protein VH951_11485 [Dehalococcoidia bacterium]